VLFRSTGKELIAYSHYRSVAYVSVHYFAAGLSTLFPRAPAGQGSKLAAWHTVSHDREKTQERSPGAPYGERQAVIVAP
jgi:hypothetical protein